VVRLNLATLGSYAGLGVLLVIPAAIAFEMSQPLVALGLEPVLVAWVLVSIAPAKRRVEMSSSIEVACSPQAAFGLVSDPRNWPKYIPQLEVFGPVDVPVRVGSVIHVKVHSGEAILDADEIVTEFEPGRRFATAIPRSPHASSGGFEFVFSSALTAITYTFRGTLSPLQSALGGWVARRGLVEKMARRRGVAMVEIKRLLEAQEPASV
jgi:hypothetical protein